MPLDLDAQVTWHGNDADLLGLLVDTCDHNRIRTFASVVVINGFPPLAGIAAHEKHVIRLVSCRGSQVGDVLVSPDIVRDVVVPDGSGSTSADEHDRERNRDAEGDLLTA